MKNFHRNLIGLFLCLASIPAFAQDYYQDQRKGWLEKAEKLKPQLSETRKYPFRIVHITEDKASFQGWKASGTNLALDSLYQSSFKKQGTVIFDFGEHLTGYFSFKLSPLKSIPDAPIRLKFTFGEVPSELAIPFDPYKGELGRAWLQDEVVTVMEIPSTTTIARRLSFRYVKIELLGSSPYFDFSISDMNCKAVTSAETKPATLLASTNQMIQDIDKVGIKTLKECMQTVYEDGPKRDRRLWIGDLYLESLANTYSFKNFNLTKRCLYLLAGLSGNNGYLIANIFETPEPHANTGQYLMDYAFLYNAALKEYIVATNDLETANDLWPVAKKQLDIIYEYLQPNGLMNDERANKEWWLFFDWKNGLDKEASLQGITIYTLKQTYDLAKLLNKQDEVKSLPGLIAKMTAAARKHLYNKSTGLFESGKEKQISYASQVWMILGGVLSQSESQKALTALTGNKSAVYPGTPYLTHYYIQALINTGMHREAKQKLTDYWGGMVQKGADTFWEVYDPINEYLSPYNFFPINSYCHAWSCTPVYFIRKYPEIFQSSGEKQPETLNQ
ncbi:MAG: glycoside hydrolase [Bacteroidales bacterium]|nr:glycoside hydrolase [Bacteroidales bacterium]